MHRCAWGTCRHYHSKPSSTIVESMKALLGGMEGHALNLKDVRSSPALSRVVWSDNVPGLVNPEKDIVRTLSKARKRYGLSRFPRAAPI